MVLHSETWIRTVNWYLWGFQETGRWAGERPHFTDDNRRESRNDVLYDDLHEERRFGIWKTWPFRTLLLHGPGTSKMMFMKHLNHLTSSMEPKERDGNWNNNIHSWQNRTADTGNHRTDPRIIFRTIRLHRLLREFSQFLNPRSCCNCDSLTVLSLPI